MAKKISSAVSLTHRDIITAVRNGEYAPIYLLMGEEPYYIDRISEYIADNVLTEDEKGFNLVTMYCTKETAIADVINAAKRYPMMSRYQVVLVKEFQNVKDIDALQYYAQKPLESTILVLCYKHGKVDGRKKVVTLISQVGVVYESKKLKDGMLPSFIDDYLRRKNVFIDDTARMMMVENIGSDLSRMAGELEKLCISLPEGTNRITPDLIERNIGISKEFNGWEFRTAIVNKDVVKANRILNYFIENPKANPFVMTLSMLFNFFSGVMMAYYSPDRSERGLMAQLDLNSPWQLRDYTTAMSKYTAMKTMQIIGKLREADAQLKGVGKGSLTDGDVMRELLYFIMH